MWYSPKRSPSLTSPITQLVADPLGTTESSMSPRMSAVAYADGSSRFWSYDAATPEMGAVELVTFNGQEKQFRYGGDKEDEEDLHEDDADLEEVLMS